MTVKIGISVLSDEILEIFVLKGIKISSKNSGLVQRCIAMLQKEAFWNKKSAARGIKKNGCDCRIW